ncbi:MAG: transposase family protein [Pseudomonadota bacterium]
MIKVYVRQADCLTAEEVSVVDALMAKTFGALEFIEFLSQIKDHRRAEGKKRKLVKLLFATILAVLSGAIFYCKIHRYIKANREKLNDAFGFGWDKVPAYSSIRFVL